MPARPRGSARGSFRRISSTIRKMDKRKTAKTPPPPRFPSRIRSNPPRRSRSSRPVRVTPLSRSPPTRRTSSSPGKGISRKPRDELRSSIEAKRIVEISKNRERTPEKKYVEKLPYEGSSKELQSPSYTKEVIKHINISVPNYYKDKLNENNSNTLNRTIHLENFTLVRRQGKNAKKEFKKSQNTPKKYWNFGVNEIFISTGREKN